MYADQLVAGTKRSIRERLNGVDDDFARRRSTSNGKRQCQDEGKWKHDLYEDEGPSVSRAKVGANDLRLKLQKRVSQQAYHGLKSSAVRDLREKLSGTMHPPPSTSDPPKAKPTQPQESAKTVTRSASTAQGPAAEKKRSTNPASSKKKSQSKVASTVQDLLKSLDLEKYSITFQAEEVDMTALIHMTDEDLKALGIPMGPRKKILLAVEPKS